MVRLILFLIFALINTGMLAQTRITISVANAGGVVLENSTVSILVNSTGYVNATYNSGLKAYEYAGTIEEPYSLRITCPGYEVIQMNNNFLHKTGKNYHSAILLIDRGIHDSLGIFVDSTIKSSIISVVFNPDICFSKIMPTQIRYLFEQYEQLSSESRNQWDKDLINLTRFFDKVIEAGFNVAYSGRNALLLTPENSLGVNLDKAIQIIGTSDIINQCGWADVANHRYRGFYTGEIIISWKEEINEDIVKNVLDRHDLTLFKIINENQWTLKFEGEIRTIEAVLMELKQEETILNADAVFIDYTITD